MNAYVANTWQLTKFFLKTVKLRAFIWILSIITLTVATPLSFVGLYDSEAEINAMAQTMENPAMIAMLGPADLNNYTIGVMTAHQMLLFTAVAVGAMSILLTTFLTRADEEDGRMELLHALSIGRAAPLVAAMIVMIAINVILGITTAAGLYALQIETMGLEGSLLYGLALTGTGLVFTGITAIFAQVSENTRGTSGMAFAVLLTSYLVRAVTDISNPDLSWASPLGWVSKAEAYAANNWLPFILMVCLFLLASSASFVFYVRRDLGRGMIASRSGKSYGSALLRNPLGLIIRLQRTSFTIWILVLFVTGASYGSVLGDLDAFFAENEAFSQMLAAEGSLSLIEAFMPMLIIVLVLLSAIPTIMSFNRLRGEEKKERLDLLLARPLARVKLILSFILVAALTAFFMMSAAALGLYTTGNAVVEGGLALSTIYGATLAYYPAMLVLIGLSALLVGVLPKATAFIWAFLAYTFVVAYLGDIFQLPDWAGYATPFSFVGDVPLESVSTLTLILISTVALLLASVGMWRFKERDI
ncbi:ABC transporter permease [Paenalkalicoccus suaedae]|uniref:ABC transporter permease n=1 Tax=Paenalkalicoccus suaedae TaxID=2592382 RepID=A0A859FGG3_9BACI|nr:ABC transporter permease [Paenalkalicoccus suaedae]QKS72453.1 ABC transporter permease [Paenalkalicoccus suaedae]